MKRLSHLVHKFFDIREGELSISLWMLSYIFLVICALLIVKPTVNALFLSELGAEALAEAFIITAIVAVILSYAYNKSLEKYALKNVIKSTLLVFALAFMIMGSLTAFDLVSGFLAYLFYIFVGMFALLATSQFWVLANVVFNVREAKRLFGFIGAGGILGGIVGGYLTSLLAPVIGNSTLIIIAGFMIMSCVWIFKRIWKERVEKLSKYKRKERATVSTESSVKLIFKSRHLSFLALTIGLGVLVAKLIDYQFSHIASEQIPDAVELAAFFGFWFSTFNIVSLVVQLFVTRHVLERTDIGFSLLLLPLGVISCCVLLFLFPELWVVVLLKGLDGSLKQSLHKSSVELLALPIPSDVKNKTKTFIDVVVDSLATGLAGLFLIFIIKGLQLPSTAITALIAFMVVAWILTVYKVRDTYLGTFKESIINREELNKRKRSSLQIRKNMRLVFETGSDKDILKLSKRVPEVAHSSLIDPVRKLLKHPNHEIKAVAIENLQFLTSKPIPEIQDLLHIKEDHLILAVMDYLLSQDHISYQFFESYLDDEQDYIATAALLALAQNAQDNPSLADKYNLELRVNLYIKELESHKSDLRIPEIVRLIETLGFVKDSRYHKIIDRYLIHQNPLLKAAAIHAAGKLALDRFLPVLFVELEDFSFRESVTTAITRYGNHVIPLLEQRYVDESQPQSVRMAIPEIIAGIRSERAFRALVRLCLKGSYKSRTKSSLLLYKWREAGCDYKIRTRVLRNAINKEVNLHKDLLDCYFSLKIVERSKLTPDKVISLPEKTARAHLINQVKAGMDEGLRRIFHLLSLFYDPEDVFIAYRGLISDRKESKLNAIEYLDGLLGRNLKGLLFPIIESGIINTDLDSDAYHSKVDLKSQEECYRILYQLENREIDGKLIDLTRWINEPHVDELLELYASSSNKKIAKLAVEVLNSHTNSSKTG
ncbi:MAG: Npt1/Npt2 family nucleotide transporter [Nonlabens sp.]